MADPNKEICPNYVLPEFADVQLLFTVDSKTDEEAAVLLKNLWNLKNTKDIGNWERLCAAEAQAARQVVELTEQEAEQWWVLQDTEEAEAKKEEQKKHKNKYMLIPNRSLSDTTLILPPQHALNKLHKGDYVPLYLFTNQGIWEAEEEGSGDEDLLTLVQTDKGPTFQTSTSVRAKKYKVKDKALSWEEFGQANYRMLGAMCQQEWPDDCLKMVCDFWVALETHFWRHNSSKYRRHTLLVYQGRVQKDWHKMLGTVDAFHLLPLNAGRLNDYHQELLDNAYMSKIEAIRVSTSSPPAHIPMLTFSHLFFYPTLSNKTVAMFGWFGVCVM